jgi:hypothetical protein
MSKVIIPKGVRSPTAIAGQSDLRDETIYSSVVAGTTLSGEQKVFTVPQGQSIPLWSAGAHPVHTNHTVVTTNLTKAGELGSGVGDISVRALGITAEPALISTAGVESATAGMTPADVVQFVYNTTFTLRVGGKKQIEGPTWFFPNMGGVSSSGVTTVPAAAAGATLFLGSFTNGPDGIGGRKLKLPILIARSDTLEGECKVPTGSFTQSNPALVWYTLLSLVRADVR